MATCEKCGLPLIFTKLSSGKFRPTNPDGSDHFDICRQLQFTEAKKHGKEFMHKTELGGIAKGIEHKNKRIYTEITARPIKGKKYFDTKCNCIPWEYCEVCAPLIAVKRW